MSAAFASPGDPLRGLRLCLGVLGLILGRDALASERVSDSIPPRVLLVTAHPDDETTFAGSVFKIVRTLKGCVDLAVITNGESGFRYAALAEPIYGLRLTEEVIGRTYLPTIRKRELLAAGAVLGIRSFFFLDQVDAGYLEDAPSVLAHQWDVEAVRRSLRSILDRGHYDFVFILLPTATTHGAHQAAALLALEVVGSLPEAQRPVILGSAVGARAEPRPAFVGRAEYPLTLVPSERPILLFDRAQTLGPGATLDYRIVVNWVRAEHKSQGLLQAETKGEDLELFYDFAVNDARAAAAAHTLFGRLTPLLSDRWHNPGVGLIAR